MTHADLAPVFCDELIDQELDDTDAYIFVQRAGKSVGLRSILKVRLILLDFADYLIYYTRKEVTYELLTHEYNYWR